MTAPIEVDGKTFEKAIFSRINP
ncbi:uncharacterized protein METZ01_LOCUS413567 [marine metagenome]|uniref:Uncharacterized protein n=1 Tax=marine metagenome TaxID=408172 RepID=A0A382WPL7_9ZZZZ